MTTAHDKDALEPNAFRATAKRGLRMVVGGVTDTQFPAKAYDFAATPCITLQSAIEEKGPVSASILGDLFKKLAPGEHIDFVHSICRRPAKLGAASATPYALRIDIACAAAKRESMKKLVADAMLTACPGFHFVPAIEHGDANRESPLPHIVQFVLAGAVVASNAVTPKVDDGLGALYPTSKRSAVARPQHWPFPGKLSNWALTAPLFEELELPDVLDVCVRVHGFSLNDEACKTLHKTLLRVLAGNLSVYHPDSPIATYSASEGLKEATADLVRHWLRHPVGYAIDCVVYSSTDLGEIAQRRIARDVFGDRPFECVRRTGKFDEPTFALPTLTWAITPEQGIPALMPAQWRLHTIGIPRHFAAPQVTPPQTGAWLGATVCGHRSTKVALPAASRSRHVAIFGSSGSGKSNFMRQIIAQDIADLFRLPGVGHITSHDDDHRCVLDMIPPERAKDVVRIDTSDLLNTVCINPLEGMRENPVHAQFVVNEVMSLIDMLFEGKDTSGPVTRNNIRNLLLLTGSIPAEAGGATFINALRILEDSDFCDYVMSKCRDRNIVSSWEKFKRTTSSENGYAAWLHHMMARLSPFVNNPIMKRLINRPDSTFDPAAAMRDGKIVLINLSKGVLQDTEVQVLGSLLLMKFFGAALARGHLPAEQRRPFHLFVDEFQTLANDSSPRLFSEARKFNLFLTTSNQTLSQLNNRWGRSSITESILANTATKFLFRLGPADCEMLKNFFSPQFNEAAMTNLPDFHAVACMSDNNCPVPPFAFRASLATGDPELHAPACDVIRWSDEKYAVPVAEANQELMKLYNISAESLGITPPPENEKPKEESRSLFHSLTNEATAA